MTDLPYVLDTAVFTVLDVFRKQPGCQHLLAGVLAFSDSGGFLLSHSVPKYPDSPNEAAFGGIRLGQLLNGQSFVCVSLDPAGLEDVGEALKIANLDIFSPHSLNANLSTRQVVASKPAVKLFGTIHLQMTAYCTYSASAICLITGSALTYCCT